MSFSQAIIKLKTEPIIKAHGNTLRGFIAHKFPQYDILHNHMKDGGLLYLYPRVQYKIIDGIALIIGIEEGVQTLQEIEPQLEIIQVNGNNHRISHKQFSIMKVQLSSVDTMVIYSFVRPWLALNEKNFPRYNQLKTKVKKSAFLKKILIGNLLSISKSFGYIVEQEINIESLDLIEKKSFLKGTPMLGFLGTFSINFEIPDYWGIGKSVSRGFGTVKRAKG